MNKKITTSKKSDGRRPGVTPLQAVAIIILMTTVALISINSMVTYGSGRQPSENIFRNSQTISVISA